MEGHAQVVAFVPTVRHADALAFYRDAIGLTLVADTPFSMVFRSGDTTIRLHKVPGYTPYAFTQLGWDVSDLDAEVDALAARGVAFERFDGMDQDARGIWSAPDGARVAWFKDPDGNLLSLSQGA